MRHHNVACDASRRAVGLLRCRCCAVAVGRGGDPEAGGAAVGAAVAAAVAAVPAVVALLLVVVVVAVVALAIMLVQLPACRSRPTKRAVSGGGRVGGWVGVGAR